MYCKNCGIQYPTDDAVVCVQCGTKKGDGTNFCPNCGKPVQSGSAVCLSCGVSMKPSVPDDAKSKLVAGLLGIFLGAFGVHNFYLGYTKKAVIQVVCTVIGFILSCIVIGVFIVLGIEIWGLVEGIMILTGKIDVDGEGNPLKD